MRATALSPEQANLLSMIESSGKALLGIIEDILDISKIEAGRLALEPEDFDLRPLLQEVGDTVFVAAATKGIRLVRQVDDDVPDRLHGDAKRLRQVLINLVGNAIKFSGDKDVTLRVETEPSGQLRFSVIDRGPGIPPDQQAAIFERFRQGDGSLSRSHGGTGLGLAICKTLVELMGGRMGLRSALGHGSTFWFTINAVRAGAPGVSAPPPVPVPPPAPLGVAGDLPVLLAEDNPTNQFIITRSLERRGLEVDVVGNGAEALERLAERSYAIVLMDIQMPVMSGYTAIEKIRAAENGATRLPIIALTANATPEAMVSVLDVGADAYMTKPVRLDALYDKIVELTAARAKIIA
jgi:CheY-like chemotaxis protein